MAYNFTLASSLSVLSFLVVFYVFLDHLLRGEKTEVNTNFSLFIIAILVWNFGSIFEISATNDAALLFWKKFTYIGITFIGVFWLTLALNITAGDGHVRLFRGTFFILLGPNLISLVALFTNEIHGHFFREIGLRNLAFGPFFYLSTIFFFLYMFVGIFLYLVHFLEHTDWYYRRQSLFMVVGAVIPLTFHLLYVLRVFKVTFDVTPITFSVSALVFLLTISRYGLFNIIPIAHRRMVDSMKDGVIVLDKGGTIVEINNTARELMNVNNNSFIGKSYGEVINKEGDNNERLKRILAAVAGAPSSFMEDINLVESFPGININVSISNINGNNSHQLGKLAVIRDVTERVNTEKQLHELSIRDDLTKLYNQRYFYKLLSREVQRADRQNHSLSLLVLDIDNFKKYNDKYGHIEGNKVLTRVAELVLENIRNGVDSAFRFGGDEFTAVLPEADVSQATHVAERIRECFEKCKIHNLTLSLGIAEYKQQCGMEDLFEMADQAMYKAKRSGRNRLHILKADDFSI
jgi:diguanylate cyclase (GGDEF)-like protein/PAS domain S-box-containing protein